MAVLAFLALGEKQTPACDSNRLRKRGIDEGGCDGVEVGSRCRVAAAEGYLLYVRRVDFDGLVTLEEYDGNLRAAMNDNSYELVWELVAEVEYSCVQDGPKSHRFQLGGAFLYDAKAEKSPCTMPELPEGSEQYCAGTSACLVYCAQGYDGGARRYTCGRSGVYEAQPGRPASCSPTTRRRLTANASDDCDGASAALLAPYPGMYSTNCGNATSGSHCAVDCAEGYAAAGDPALYICDGGSLAPASGGSAGGGADPSAALPTCTPIECLDALLGGAGVVHDCAGKVTGETCSAVCAQGYAALHGSPQETFICGADGAFAGIEPACVANQCAALDLGALYVTEDCAGKGTGDSCVVSCADGDTSANASGNVAIFVCEASGQFTGSPPTCQPSTCMFGAPEGPELVADGCIGLRTNETCAVSCAAGYDGLTEEFRCSDSGVLVGTEPRCVAKECPDVVPPSSRQYSHSCSGARYGDRCVVSCAAGHQATQGNDSETFRCVLNSAGVADFQGSLPQCEPQPCLYGLPDGLEFEHNCSGVRTGETCTESCAAGFQASGLVGSRTRLCNGSSVLLEDAANGALICESLEPLKCSSVAARGVEDNCEGKGVGESCLAFCATGYETTGGATYATLTCTKRSSTTAALAGEFPACEPRPCSTTQLEGSAMYIHNCASVVFGGTCSVACADYTNIHTLTCSSSGWFDGEMPACGGEMSSSSTTSSDTVAVSPSGMQGAATTSSSAAAGPTSTSAPSSVTAGAATAASTTDVGPANASTSAAAPAATAGATASVTSDDSSGEERVVRGSFEVSVSDPAGCAADAAVRQSMQRAVAAWARVPTEFVQVQLSHGSRRLSRSVRGADAAAGARRAAAAAGVLKVQYTLRIPVEDADHGSAEAAAALVAALWEGNALSSLQAQLKQDPVLSAYEPRVTSFTVPALSTEVVASRASVLGSQDSPGPDTPRSDDRTLVLVGSVVGGLLALVGGCIGVRICLVRRAARNKFSSFDGEGDGARGTAEHADQWRVGDAAMVRASEEEEWQAGKVVSVQPLEIRLDYQPGEPPCLSWQFVRRPGRKAQTPGKWAIEVEEEQEERQRKSIKVAANSALGAGVGSVRPSGKVKYRVGEVVFVRAHYADPWAQAVVVVVDTPLVRLLGSEEGSLPTAWPFIVKQVPAGDPIKDVAERSAAPKATMVLRRDRGLLEADAAQADMRSEKSEATIEAQESERLEVAATEGEVDDTEAAVVPVSPHGGATAATSTSTSALKKKGSSRAAKVESSSGSLGGEDADGAQSTMLNKSSSKSAKSSGLLKPSGSLKSAASSNNGQRSKPPAKPSQRSGGASALPKEGAASENPAQE